MEDRIKAFLEMYNLKKINFPSTFLRIYSTIRMHVNQERDYIRDAAQLKRQGLPMLIVKGL